MNTVHQAPATAINTDAYMVERDGVTHARRWHRRISWGAIIAGMVMALVIQLFFSLLGTGIGLSTVDPAQYDTPSAASLGIGAAIWWVVSSILALFAGGWVAGHLAPSPLRSDALLHGLVTWGLATIMAFYLLASAVGSIVSGGASLVGKAASVTAQGAAAVAGPIKNMAEQQLQQHGFSMTDIKSQVSTLLAQTDKPALQPNALKQQANNLASRAGSTAATVGSDGQAPGQDIQSLLQRIVNSGADTVQAADRQALVNIVIARTGVSQAEAQQRVNGWIDSYQQAQSQIAQAADAAKAKARQIAAATAQASARASLAAALALLLGAIAAAIGGALAGRRRTAADARA